MTGMQQSGRRASILSAPFFFSALVCFGAALFCCSPGASAGEGRCARAEAEAIPENKVLPALARKIGAGEPLRIVALGSSSTEGTPDIPKDALFPAVLGRELAQETNARVEVINKGKGGENIYAMVARLERDVLAQNPDLVVWQLGVNDVIQMDGIDGPITRMQEALDELRRRGLPVVLVDLQAGPVVDSRSATPAMQAAIERAGRGAGVLHFHRQALMRRMVEVKAADMPELVGKDGLHMTVLAHFCTGQLLARQIAKAGRAFSRERMEPSGKSRTSDINR